MNQTYKNFIKQEEEKKINKICLKKTLTVCVFKRA